VAIGGYAGNGAQGSAAVAIGRNTGRTNQGVQSVAVGNFAANSEQGDDAVAIGPSAARGDQRTNTVAIGSSAGRCQQNTQSVAVGYAAGKSNQNSRSIAIGNQAGEFAQNTAAISIGYLAGHTRQNASAVAIGYEAGKEEQNTYAVSVGRQAGESTQNAYAISIGYLAGQEFQNAGSVSVGYQAGRSGQGSASVALGQNAAINYQDSYSVAIGGDAGRDFQNTSAVAIGFDAARTHQRSYSVAIGRGAANHKQNTAAVAIGYLAGESYQAQEAVHIGFEAGKTNSNLATDGTARGQVGIGYRAGKTSQGSSSVAIGKLAGSLNQDVLSVAIGLEAGRCNQSSDSVAVGPYAGFNDQAANAVALGQSAGRGAQGVEATALGSEAGRVSQAKGAVAVGYAAGKGVTAAQGSYAVALGWCAGKEYSHDNSIVINASGAILNTGLASAFYVNPIRNDDADQFNKMLTHNVQTSEVVTVLGINVHSSNASMELSGNIYASNLYGNGSALTGISTSSDLQGVVEGGNVSSNTIQLETNTLALVAQGNVSIGSLAENHTNLHVTGNVHTTGNIKTIANVIASDLYGDGTNVIYSGLTSASQFTFPNASGKLSSVSNVAWNTSGQAGYPSEFLDISGNVVFSNGNVEMTTSDLYVFDVHMRDAIHEDGRIHFTHPGYSPVPGAPNDPQFVIESVDAPVLSINAISSGNGSNVQSSNIDSFGNVRFHQNVEVSGNTYSNLVTDFIFFNDQSTPAVSGLGIDLNNVVSRGNTSTSVVTIDNTWSMQTTGYINVGSTIARTHVVIGSDTLAPDSNLSVSGNAFIGRELVVDGVIRVMSDDATGDNGGEIRIYQSNTAPLYWYSIDNTEESLRVWASSGTNSISADVESLRVDQATDTRTDVRVGGSQTSNVVVNNQGSVYRVYGGGSPAGAGIHITTGAIYPATLTGAADTGDSVNLGSATHQWKNFYYSGSLVSSDFNLKRDIEDFNDAEARVARRIKVMMKKFRYRKMVEQKGVDGARIHSGVIAQDVENAFAEEGLDAHRYSMWSETPVYHDDDSGDIIEDYYYNQDTGAHVVNVAPDDNFASTWVRIEHPLNYPRVSRTFAYHVNYTELLCFVMANI
jgi:hypothetical protein